MTVTANNRCVGPFVCTGGETIFGYDFKIETATDLAVWRLRGGAETRLAYATDYTVTGVGAAGGGDVVLNVAATAGDRIVIDGVSPVQRSTDLTQTNAFRATTLNSEYDALFRRLQELERDIGRAVKRSRFDAQAAAPLLIPFDDDGVLTIEAGEIEVVPKSELGGSGGGAGLDLPLEVDQGGTGASSAGQARTNLGIGAVGTWAALDQAAVETAYNARVAIATQAEAEAGTATAVARWTAQRIKQAIDALTNASATRLALVVERSAVDGGNGGSTTAGARQQYGLTLIRNAGAANVIAGAALSSGRLTGLPVGWYRIEGTAYMNPSCGVSQLWLRNVSDSVDVAIGVHSATGLLSLAGEFEVTDPTDLYEIQYRVSNSVSTTGLGAASSYGDGEEIFGRFVIESLANKRGLKGDAAEAAMAAYDWSTTTTAGDPGSGKIRANSATYTAITQFYLHEVDARGKGLTFWIETFDDSSSTIKGTLEVHAESDPSKFVLYDITSLVDNGAWVTLNVTHRAAGSAIPDGQRVVVLFSRIGDKGDPGTTVPNISGLVEDTANDDQADFLIARDTSTGSDKKVKPKNLGFTSNKSAAILRTLNGKLSEIISITDWAGAGEGSDDAAAFNSAIAALSSNGGKILCPPPPAGDYRLDSGLVINKDGVVFEALAGSGGYNKNYNGVQIAYYGASAPSGSLIRVGNQADHVVGFEARNIGLNGRGLIGRLWHFTDAQRFHIMGGRNIDATTCAFLFDNGSAVANPCGLLSTIQRVSVEQIATGTDAADGFWQNGAGSTGVTGIQFILTGVRHKNGHAHRITQGDGYKIDTPYAFRQPGGSGFGIQIDGPGNSAMNGIIEHPICNTINVVNFLDPGTTIIVTGMPRDIDAPILSGYSECLAIHYLDGRKRSAAKAANSEDTIQVAGDYVPSHRLERIANGGSFAVRAWFTAISTLGGWVLKDLTSGIERLFADISGHIGLSCVPARRLHVTEDNATNTGVTQVVRLTHTTTGVPGNGIGVGMEFEVETSAGNNEIGAAIEAVATDTTPGSEDFDLLLKTMSGGAAPVIRARLPSTGGIALPDTNASHDLVMKPADDLTGERILSIFTGDASANLYAHNRETLTANRTYYVRSDGSNSNTGLVDSAGGAFLTLQKAWNTVAALDLGIYTATIQIKDATFPAGITSSRVPVGTNPVVIQGNASTPANTHVSLSSGGACFDFDGPAQVTIQNLKMSHTGNPLVRTNHPAAKVTIGTGVDFGSAGTSNQIYAESGQIVLSGTHTLSGGGANFVELRGPALLTAVNVTTVLAANITYSQSFVRVNSNGVVSDYNHVFTMGAYSVTGERYNATENGVIKTFGGGANYYPGSTAGSTASGGQYT